jgi:hypothetical protein
MLRPDGWMSGAEIWTVFGVMTGLRPSEERALPVEDLQLDGQRPGFLHQ